MATAKLTSASPPCRRFQGLLARAWLPAYILIWALALTSVLLVGLAPDQARSLLARWLAIRLDPSRTPSATFAHVLALAAHNLPITSWPLLLVPAGARENPTGRRLADALLVVAIAVNVASVGAALALWGLALVAYLPQVPFEWAAFALGASAWITHRESPLDRRQVAVVLVGNVALLLVAGGLETFAVPHR